MKALWFLPFAFAGGAEGFALFAPYLIGVLVVLYLARAVRAASAARRELAKQHVATEVATPGGALSAVQPAL
jgi:hypothetical protein